MFSDGSLTLAIECELEVKNSQGQAIFELVEAGQNVEAGATLVVLEAMKMEHSIRAQQAGVVKGLFCAEGDMVNEGTVLLEMEEA